MPDPLPSYRSLPVRPDLPPGSSWGMWGDGDVFGCLNLLTADKVLRAARLIKKGTVFALNLGLEFPDPPLFERGSPNHQVVKRRPNVQDDEILSWNTQSSSQWDGFRHVRHPSYGSYGAVDDASHGIHHWAKRGIAGRAVLADVGAWREADGRPLLMTESDPIEVSDIVETLKAQSVRVEEGDILLIRTGFLSWYFSLDQQARTNLAKDARWPGLRAGSEMLEFLWDIHVAAVAADNPALEVWPPGALLTEDQRAAASQDPDRLHELFMHFALLPLLGLPIGELWDLDALAHDCAADGVYEFFLTSAPLNLSGAVASPPNALAIK